MKHTLTILLASIFISSCGTDEVEYPIIYTYDTAVEVSSAILTADSNGEIIEIDKLESLVQLGVTPFEFFTSVSGLQTVESITVDSETEVTVDFGMITPIGQVVSFTYVDNEVSQLGLVIEDDKIRQRGCFELTSSPTYPSSLNANLCDEEDASIGGRETFSSLGFSTNDTLAYSIIEYVYPRSN